VKVKVRHEGVFVVGGIRDANAFDGVLVGEQVGDKLDYRGVIEWGFRAADVLELLRAARLFDTRTSPFVDLPAMRGAVWIEPRLRAEVSYAEVTGGRLRAPTWRRLIVTAYRRQSRDGIPRGLPLTVAAPFCQTVRCGETFHF
jgi:ATP-dependent DNA ligase